MPIMMFRDIMLDECQWLIALKEQTRIPKALETFVPHSLQRLTCETRLYESGLFTVPTMPKQSPALTPEKRPPTLSDVAAEAGVSRSAVARVLLGTGGEHVRVSEQTRLKVKEVAGKLGYAPNRNAQQLRGLASKMLGVIVDTVNFRVMAERLFAIEEAAAARGYRILVGRVRSGEEQLNGYIADFIGRGVEAMFCLFDLEPGRDERVKKAFYRHFRKVIFHGRAAWRGGFSVQIDTASAIRAAVEHLVANGKKRPALSLWNEATDELMTVRRQAFTDAIAVHSLESSPGLIWDAASTSAIPDTQTMDRGVEALVVKEGADAILASNDIWAVRFIQTLKARGFRIPQDVSIVGYDDLDISRVVEPALSSVNPNHEAYANACMDLLLKVAHGEPMKAAEKNVIVTPSLFVRQSS